MTQLVWFRQDLRIQDNPALFHAAKSGEPVLFVYIDDDTSHPWQMGAASRWWLRESLLALSADLNKKYKANLVVAHGNPLSELQALIKEHNLTHVYWNRCYEPFAVQRDKEIKEILLKQNISVHSYNGALLKEPWEVMNKQGTPFKVFTPFWRCMQQLEFRDILAAPKQLKPHPATSKQSIDDILPLPSIPWYTDMATTWQPGEAAAKDKLGDFLENLLTGYSKARDFPAQDHTSHLSPHLHFGEISPIQIWTATHFAMHDKPKNQADGWRFLSEVAWREFSTHLLYHFPELPDAPVKTEFSKFPWKTNAKALKAWQRGMTGFPIVDAGMRQLWKIGYMHNRVRMIVASFLIKDLFIAWQEGEAWFWDTLVDADLANNAASWQWVAGSGMDAAPYFRVFNPMLQGEKFDPDGEYVKTWLPELAKLPAKYLQAPWLAPERVLKDAGIVLGKNYPKPMVEHDEMRKKALEYYKQLRG